MAARQESSAPALVGRATELGVIRATLARAAVGQAGTLLLLGDAGVGKTFLVQNACAAEGEDSIILSGACLPLMSMTVPFLALRAALRDAVHRYGARLPTPSWSIEGTVSAAEVPLAFDAWLDELCRDRLVVLVVDDLQWADQSTLDVLTYVIAGPAERRLAVIATVRNGEVGEAHPLSKWLADIRRLPRTARITLGPLDRIEVGAQIAGVLGTTPHESLIDDVFAHTQGNAYLTQLVLSGIDPTARRLPADLPIDLKSAVLQSWLRLSPPARELTRLLAVGGLPARADELHAISRGIDGMTDVRELVQEALTAGVLDIARDGGYWFHHPLHAEVLALELDADDLTRWHAAFADHYERAATDAVAHAATLVSIADHRYKARQWPAAYRAALRGAEAAETAGEAAESIRLIHRAIELLDRVSEAQVNDVTLLHRLRIAAAKSGAHEEELDAIEALLAELDSTVDPLLMAELLVRRMHLRFSTGVEFFAVADVHEAVRLSAQQPQSWQHAFAVAELAHAEMWAGDPDASAHASHALALARAAGDPRALSYAMTAVTIDTCIGAVRPTPAPAFTAEAVEAALASGDYWGIVHAATWEANTVEIWSTRAYASLARHRRQQLSALGAPHVYLAKLAADEAMSWLAIGAWRECLEALRIALGSNPGPLADVSARLTAARLASWQGRQSEAEAHLARAEELFSGMSDYLNFEFDAVRAEVCLGAGDAEGAVSSALHGATAPGVPPTMSEWLIPLAARAIADQVQAARDARSTTQNALDRLEDLQSQFPTVLKEPGESTPIWAAQVTALTHLYAAEVGRARLDSGNAEQWLLASTACRDAMLAWEELYACWRGAEALLVHPDGKGHGRVQAASVIRHGLELADGLQAAPIQAQLTALAASSRIPIDRAVDHGVSAVIPGLTEREREILAHVVAGRSYSEIASALTISEKTVSSHISNLLRKTGSSNRFDLARLARAHGDRH